MAKARSHGPDGARRAALDRSRLIRTALALADEHGLEALTFSRLAAELGVTPPALYWHVRNRDELVAAMMEHAFSDLHPPVPSDENWQDDARQLYTWLRDRLLARPALFAAPAFSKLLPYRFIEIGLAGSRILARSGLRDAALVRASRALFWHTYGFALFESSLRGSAKEELPGLVIGRAVSGLGREDLARLLGNLDQLTDYQPAEVFAYGLDLLLRGIAADGEQSRRGLRRRRTVAAPLSRAPRSASRGSKRR
jgi:AcrR family transcriptional regulator